MSVFLKLFLFSIAPRLFLYRSCIHSYFSYSIHKGSQAWNNYEFFSFDFRQNFVVRTFSRWLSIRGTKIFWRDIPKNFCSNSPIRWVPKRFFRTSIFIVEICILIWDFWVIFKNYSMDMLNIRGNDFTAHWAYEEMISSHTEHTRNEFLRMLSQR